MMKTKGLNIDMRYGFDDGDAVIHVYPSSRPSIFVVIMGGWYWIERWGIVVVGMIVKSNDLKFGIDNLRGDVADLSKIIVRVRNRESTSFYPVCLSVDERIEYIVEFFKEKIGTKRDTITYLLCSGYKYVSKEDRLKSIGKLYHVLLGLRMVYRFAFFKYNNVLYDLDVGQKVKFWFETDSQLLSIIADVYKSLRLSQSEFMSVLIYAGVINFNEFAKEVDTKFKGYGYPQGIEIGETTVYCANRYYQKFREWLPEQLDNLETMLKEKYFVYKEDLKKNFSMAEKEVRELMEEIK